jgi:hypothetical protein
MGVDDARCGKQSRLTYNGIKYLKGQRIRNNRKIIIQCFPPK